MAQLLYVVKIACQIEPAIFSSAYSIANDVASKSVYFALHLRAEYSRLSDLQSTLF